MTHAFNAITFADPDRTHQILEELQPPESVQSHLAAALEEASHPDTVLLRLARFFDAAPEPQTEWDRLASDERYTRLLTTLLGQSDYLTDILCQDPGIMTTISDRDALEATPERDALFDVLWARLELLERFEEQRHELRLFKQREILRIAARDLFAHAPIREVTEDLSNLADAALEASLRCAAMDLDRRFGAPCQDGESERRNPATFCILAMGKLGGRELNFSSDIDLIFLYSDEGETTGGESGTIDNRGYYQRLGERIIKAMSETTAAGNVFRVDMRLRPYGDGAPLACSVDHALAYYENTGQAWERQALIKARPAAGDLALGELFLEQTRPFVFPRYFDDATLEDIRQVKAQMELQIERQGQTHTEVKLGRGGIRDVEFTVQMLQLLNGGRMPELRVRNTLDAIDALGQQGFLRPLDADTLARNYRYMRRVEHRLQIKGGQQVHALPDDPRELEEFALRLGYPDRDTFMRDYKGRADATRAILEQFLASEGAGDRWVYDLLHPQHGGEIGLKRLLELGFASPERAREELMQLYAGPSDRPNSLRVRQQFTSMVPHMLRTMAQWNDPDAILTQVGHMLASIHAPGALYDILAHHPHLPKYLVELVANSRYLARILAQEPGLFDTFGSHHALAVPATHDALEEELEALSEAYPVEEALYHLHAGETLRIGMRELFQGIDVFQVGQELTVLAEVILDRVLHRARRRMAVRYGDTPTAFAVLGLGKMGGAELGYGSDLDIVFVHGANASTDSGMAPSEFFSAVASATINGLKERTAHGVLYDVDARLRPDGMKGMLAVSASRLVEYYQHEAQAWERLALVKARAVAGPPDFCTALNELVRELSFHRPFTSEDVAHIADVRDRLAASASPLDLKKYEGGLIEIEFLIRLLQVRHAAEHPALMRNDVRGALTGLQKAGALKDESAQALLDAYTLLRRIENRIRMAEGASGSELPDDPDARADLAARLGIEGDLLDLVNHARQQVRRLYQATVDAWDA